MDTIQYLRLTLVLVFGVIPALLLCVFAGLGLFLGAYLFLASDPMTGLMIMATSLLGLFGAYSMCCSAVGVEATWQRLGLLAGILAAGTFICFEFSAVWVSARLEVPYWVFSPIFIATFLLLESFFKSPLKDEKAPTIE